MKKLFIILLSMTLLQCSNDFLDRSSLTQIAENNFWASESDAFLALNGVYAVLQGRSMYGGNLNGFQGIPGFDGFGDNSFNAFKWEGPGFFMEGTTDPTFGPILNIWNDHYRGIARVNSVIFNLENLSDEVIPQDTRQELLGQAYFLRALFYFNLSVYFEEVPLILEPQTLETAFVAKNTYDEIYAQIVTDLTLASEFLPTTQPDDLFGYATKGAALGLFARVQLYNQVYDGEFGVLNLTNQVLGLGYSLHPNYADLFTEAGENSPEIVFAARFFRNAATSNGENFSATFLASPKGDMRPMRNLVFDYYCTDGLPITTSPLYNPSSQGANRDPRANASIYFVGDQWLDEPVRTFTGNSPTGYGQRKYIRRGPGPDGTAVFEDGSQDFYVIRFADVLLMRAEALVETGDLSGAASLVNEVRARVNMPSVQDVEGIGSQSQMRDIVRHERRVELAFEGLRFMDLKRWNTVQEAVIRAAADPVGPYNPQYLGKRTEVFPIPQAEIDVNPNLVQNPNW